jgi:hypothetical protein
MDFWPGPSAPWISGPGHRARGRQGVDARQNAGKTSLTERLLHTAGVIDEVGSIDDTAAQVHVLSKRLPTLTHCEGVLVSRFARHRPVHRTTPTRL